MSNKLCKIITRPTVTWNDLCNRKTFWTMRLTIVAGACDPPLVAQFTSNTFAISTLTTFANLYSVAVNTNNKTTVLTNPMQIK